MADAFVYANLIGPTQCVSIDASRCVGCNACANICRIQSILPNYIPGETPIVAYPDECWYCGCCVEVCRTGALKMNLPINQRILFKRKRTGEVFRLGGADSPEKSYFRPPYGWMREENR